MKIKSGEFICKECGKKAPIDELNSDKYKTAFDLSKPCSCGGKWKFKFKK